MFDRQIEKYDESQKQTLKLFMESIGYVAMRKMMIMLDYIPQDKTNATENKGALALQLFKDIGITELEELIFEEQLECIMELMNEKT